MLQHAATKTVQCKQRIVCAASTGRWATQSCDRCNQVTVLTVTLFPQPSDFLLNVIQPPLMPWRPSHISNEVRWEHMSMHRVSHRSAKAGGIRRQTVTQRLFMSHENLSLGHTGPKVMSVGQKTFSKLKFQFWGNKSVFFLSIVLYRHTCFSLCWFRPDIVTNVGSVLEKFGESDSLVIHDLAG